MVSSKQVGTNLRWIDYARRSMQRLGFLKWVLSLASVSRGQSLESLTRAFFVDVTKSVPVPPESRESFENYVRQQQLHRRYREGEASVQNQDLFLSDPILPSHSGAITGEMERTGYRHAVYVEIPTWAVRLRMLRPQNYTVTDRGRVLLLPGSESSEGKFEARNKNPLYLNDSERYLSIFCLLDADGDLLTEMYRGLIAAQTFTRSDAGEAAADALEQLRTKLRNTSTGPLQLTRAKMDRTIAAVRKQSQSSHGPRESIATPRTEPLVDCGILIKRYPDKYEYSFTDWGRSFLSNLISVSSVGDFLESHLSSVIASLTERELSNETPTLRTVARPYSQLRAGLGYVSLRELALASVASALSSPGAPLFEIGTIEHALKLAATQLGFKVRLALGRAGGIAQVRIDQRALTKDDA